MNAALLQSAFKVALPYDAYLATDAAKAGSWRSAEAQAIVTGAQRELLSTFTRHMPVLVISGVWCGDCAQQGPMLQAIAKACPKIDLRWIDRDTNPELRDMVRICGGHRVPTVIWMAEDFEFVSLLGDRTLPRYRAAVGALDDLARAAAGLGAAVVPAHDAGRRCGLLAVPFFSFLVFVLV